MPDIVLTTFNARYSHAAFGLRYLRANLGPLRDRSSIVEFDLTCKSTDAVEAILACDPRVVGVGVYIWNVAASTQLVADLKRVRPDLTVVVGGPEVSHEVDRQPICAAADYVVTGEADHAFADLCEKLLAGRRPLMRVIPAEPPGFDGRRPLVLPYDLYTDEDLAHRVVYVEASRGCPFRCEFCLSSLDVPVRNVPVDALLEQFDRLLARGLRQFKFVDRTFNLNLSIGTAILRFFLDRLTPDLFLHFEMIPDRLPEPLRELIAAFPPGTLQFEVGIQTFNPDVAKRISRRQDYAKLADNLLFLRERTGVHVHADLIVGLPGEDVESFAAGFDRLIALRPQEVQVGILKRLRGTPIVRHDAEFGMVYSDGPPYEVLRTNAVDFPTMQRLRRFARYWDLIGNSGNFVETTPHLWAGGSPFAGVMAVADHLFAVVGKTHAIALHGLMQHLFTFLTERGMSADVAANAVWRDYQRGGRSDRPAFLAPYVPVADTRVVKHNKLPARQGRHLAAVD